VWDARWLELLVETLEARPHAALAYPASNRIDGDGRELRRAAAAGFATRAGAGALARCLHTVVAAPVGSAVYGLFRVAALERTGGFPVALAPDRLLLAEVALAGDIVRVPTPLWTRRFRHTLSLDRQRRASFPAGAPLWTRAPVVLQHTALLLAGARRADRRGVHTLAGVAYPAAALVRFVRLRALRLGRRLRRAVKRLRRRLAAALRR
jgi:hypothetical protein